MISQSRKMLSIIFELSKVTRCCQRELVLCEGLTFMQFYILDLIANKGAMELFNLHASLSVEKSTTTRLIEPLLKQDLLQKKRSNDDTRVFIVKLTEKGMIAHQKAWECIEEYLNKLDSAIPSNKKEQVYESVQLFISIMKPCQSLSEE